MRLTGEFSPASGGAPHKSRVWCICWSEQVYILQYEPAFVRVTNAVDAISCSVIRRDLDYEVCLGDLVFLFCPTA